MTSDFALKIPAELEAASQLRTAQYFVTQRPWLDLYGVHIRPVAPFGSSSSKPFIDPALIHRCLPDELLFEIFARMTPYNLGRAACVCRKWRYTVRNPVFWRNACLKAWQVFGVVENYKILQSKYDGSWRKMWLSRPRIRTDGLYVSRNTYIRAGIAEWKVSNPVHVVCYFRYLRFYPSGRFLYKNSSQKVKDVAKFMNFRASKAECVHSGHYTLSDDKVEAAFLYPGLRPTVWRIRLRLRGTRAGANNRMDLLSLVTSGVNDDEVSSTDEDILGVVEGWQEDETHNPDVPAVTHKRGLTPFVFIPFEEMPYFRYLRFYPSGICLYKSSIENVKDMVKFMNFSACTEKCGYSGDYSMFDGEVVATFECPGSRPTVLRIRLRLRLWGTTAGANNRMDLLPLVNYDGVLSSPDEEALDFAPDVTQNGGLEPLAFVPFEEVKRQT